MKSLCIGQSKYDIITNINKVAADGETILVNNVVECGGGSASNIAYMLGKYKVDSYIASVVGDDTQGNNIKKELEAMGVHTEYMETSYGKNTSISIYLNNTTEGKKVNYLLEKEPLYMKKTEYQLEPDLIYTDCYDYGASQDALNKYGKAIKVVSANTYDKTTLELCKYCEYMLVSKEFAETFAGLKFDLTNASTLVNIYSKLHEKFPNKVLVVCIGDEGALYMVDDQIRVMPSLNLEKKDTTDSKIVFDGAFIFALLQKYDLERAVTFANIACGLSVLKVGVRYSIPDISEIMTYFRQKYPETSNVIV